MLIELSLEGWSKDFCGVEQQLFLSENFTSRVGAVGASLKEAFEPKSGLGGVPSIEPWMM